MTILAKKTPSLESFEETYKTAYSHGLEAIYSLEIVDLKTVRKIDVPLPKEKEKQQQTDSGMPPEQNGELEFDFGEPFHERLKPYFPDEPIRLLDLSFQAEASLLERGFKKIKDLLSCNFKESPLLRGMGQSHVDETQKKLTQFICNRSLVYTETVDFQSLLLSLCCGMNFKKLFSFLGTYQLGGIIPLNTSEKIEVRNTDFSKLREWRQEVRAVLNEESFQQNALSQLQKINKIFVIPWMYRRGGLAEEHEILERLEKISSQPSSTHKFLQLFSQEFARGGFPLHSFLPQAEKGIYCCSQDTLSAYCDVIGEAHSYFYHNKIHYRLDELIVYLMRTCAKEWKDYSPGFIENCLKRSPSFSIFRNAASQLEVRLS